MPALTAAHWGIYELVMRAGAPVGQARDDYEIFSGLAERLGGRSAAVSRSLSIAAMHAGRDADGAVVRVWNGGS
jgi:hypothetical protein